MSSAAKLIEAVGLRPQGPVTWGAPVRSAVPGVYVIETPAPLEAAPLDDGEITRWIRRVRTIRLDGAVPTTESLRDRLAEFWVAMEPVVYVGLAGTDVGHRIRQFYRTPLGDPRPHAGGHWVKTLANLHELLVWWADSSDPAGSEEALLTLFSGLHEGMLPFANRETARGVRKVHGITGSVLPRKSTSGPVRSTATRSAVASSATSSRGGHDLRAINAALQRMACREPAREVTAVEAARELERLGLLRDSVSRPGLPLRNLLRDRKVDHAYQEGGRWWRIRCEIGC